MIAFSLLLGARRLLRCMSLDLARLRRADAPCECPLIGVDRKRLADRQNDANDTERTNAFRVAPAVQPRYPR